MLFAKLGPIEVKNLLNSSTISLSCVQFYPWSTLTSLTIVVLDFLLSNKDNLRIILPILTYSSTVKLNDHHRDTKGKVNFASKTRAKSIIRSEDVPNIIDVIECESCLLVKKCLEQEIHNPIFDEYFTMISHEKETRNNNCVLRLPRVKLEIAKQSFYFGGAKLYNALPLDLRSVQTLEKFRKGLKELF
jgi:hypothetical protein